MNRSDKRARVLVVDDEREMAAMLADELQDRGYQATAVASGREAIARMDTESFDAVVTDLRMHGVDGFEVLRHSRAQDEIRPVILMTAYGAIDSAVEAIRQGAYHYVAKPFNHDELVVFLERGLEVVRVRREAATLRRALRDRVSPSGMVGHSKLMRAVFEMVDRVADTTAPVLITGETGTGKGLVAAALHAQGRRASAPFVTINCAALPEALLESELFGHVKGAFTGATTNRAGLFLDADGGTIFLDEIGEMALSLQAKLLHVIEHRRVRPVGGSREREVDVRIVTATHRDLRANVVAGTFREDLLYRLDVVAIDMPPLRARPEDVPDLAEHFLREVRGRIPQARVERVSAEALAAMLEYRWPGNVREFAHVIERAVLLGREPEITLADLPAQVRGGGGSSAATRSQFGDVVSMREMQRRYAAWVLEQVGGVRARAAERLDIDIKTLGRLLSSEVPVDDSTKS
jgi:two-component system response regulator HydG